MPTYVDIMLPSCTQVTVVVSAPDHHRTISFSCPSAAKEASSSAHLSSTVREVNKGGPSSH